MIEDSETQTQPRIPQSKILRAFQILLGSEGDFVHASGHSHLTTSALKKIYRKKVMTCHPDKTGGSEREFIIVNRAYSFLEAVWEAAPQNLHQVFKGIQHVNTCQPVSKPYTPLGTPIPPRSLRFGQYLFFKGLITWNSLIQSLIWQGKERPRFGILATKWDFMTPEQVSFVIGKRQMGEKIGDAAHRLGLLNSHQRMVILGLQRGYRAQVGVFFVQQQLLTQEQLEQELEAHRRHNFQYGKIPFAV